MPTNIVSKLFSDGSNEVDLELTVWASIKATSEPFTIDELADGICTANPQDQEFEDRAWIRGQVGHHVRTFSNPLCSLYICDEMPDGRYQRREGGGTS